MNDRDFYIAIDMGYGQVFKPDYLERATTAHGAALAALGRYFSSTLVTDQFLDLIPKKGPQTYGRNVFEVYLVSADNQPLKGYTVIVDDLATVGGLHDDREI